MRLGLFEVRVVPYITVASHMKKKQYYYIKQFFEFNQITDQTRSIITAGIKSILLY